MPIPTPHNEAQPGAFAQSVLMPGDPLRAKFIAENFLTDARLVNNVRGVQGYTGSWNGKAVSVMASGMGMPSIGIYSYELYQFYGVENIIRIGSAGALSEKLKLLDIVFALGACTNSAFGEQYHLPGTFAPTADFTLLTSAMREAEKLGITPAVGSILSSDTFYDDRDDAAARWARMGVLAIEMEAAALYMTAARTGKRALAICTISDHVTLGGELPSEERERGFRSMIELALNTAAAL